MTAPFKHIDIVPGYARGFSYRWDVAGSFSDPGPWTFHVESGPAVDGPWERISPALVNQYSWADTETRVVGKDAVLYFRVSLVTPKGTYASHVMMPYGDLGRREYLIAREIMRKELLVAKQNNGVPVQLWTVSTYGPKCTHCIDPVSGNVTNSKCPFCFGTGRDPGYHGPYAAWGTFSSAKHTVQSSQSGSGVVAPADFSIRMIGSPQVKKNDVVIDVTQDKRYYVDLVDVTAELRRVPIVQVLTVHEAPVSDIAYRL